MYHIIINACGNCGFSTQNGSGEGGLVKDRTAWLKVLARGVGPLNKVVKNLTPNFSVLTNTWVIPTTKVEKIRYYGSTWHKLGTLRRFSCPPPPPRRTGWPLIPSRPSEWHPNEKPRPPKKNTTFASWLFLAGAAPENCPSRAPKPFSNLVKNPNPKVLIMDLREETGRRKTPGALGTKSGEKPRDAPGACVGCSVLLQPGSLFSRPNTRPRARVGRQGTRGHSCLGQEPTARCPITAISEEARRSGLPASPADRLTCVALT